MTPNAKPERRRLSGRRAQRRPPTRRMVPAWPGAAAGASASWPACSPSRSSRRPAGCGSGSAARRWLVAELARGPAVVVLPFETLSAGEDDRFLAAGVTQELITDLMRFDGFRLYSVPASFRLDGHADPMTLGHNLGVGYVVKGSVSSDAATVRVGAQLFDAQTGQVAMERDLRPCADRRAPCSVSGRSSPPASRRCWASPTASSTATWRPACRRGVEPSMASYACVLRAYTYRRTFRDELRRPVLACLEAAVERDPDYAEAWALLGWLHLDAARYAFVPDAEVPREMGQALDFASKAVAIDPENVVALRALSAVQYHLGNFDESERIQRQALALNPNDPDTLAQLGWRLAFRGRWDEGLAYAERAIARTIDPPGWYYDPITIHLYLEGRYREMLAVGRALGRRGRHRCGVPCDRPGRARQPRGGARRRWPRWLSRRRRSTAIPPPSGAASTRSKASSTRSWTACARPAGMNKSDLPSRQGNDCGGRAVRIKMARAVQLRAYAVGNGRVSLPFNPGEAARPREWRRRGTRSSGRRGGGR